MAQGGIGTLQNPGSIMTAGIKDGTDERDSSNSTLRFFTFIGFITTIDEVGKVFDGINPPHSIKVKTFSPIKVNQEVILYPSSDYDKLPISKGEAVRFVFDNDQLTRGTWFSRVAVGNRSKVLAKDYYVNEDTSNKSVDAFDGPPDDAKLTESGLVLGNPQYDEPITSDNPTTEDREIWGRKDAFVAKADGTFEIGKLATEQVVLGNQMQSYLTSATQGKEGMFVVIESALKTLDMVSIVVVAIVNAINILAPGTIPPPQVSDLNKSLKILETALKAKTLSTPVDNWLSKTVKTK